MSVMAISARGLQVQLGARRVLHGLDLQVRASAWTCVVGPNGAGKSTLLKALAGLLPHTGEVSWQGQALHTLGRRERAQRLTWLGQGEPGLLDLRVHDVAMLGRLPHQRWLAGPTAEDLAMVRTALQALGAWDWRERVMGELSGGERQRVLLARALAGHAPLMLMDEPLSNLDPPHQVDWLEQVHGLRAQGCTVLSVLHELGMALQADELLVMQAGRLVHQGAPDDPATREALVAVFDGRIRILPLDGQWVVLPNLNPGLGR